LPRQIQWLKDEERYAVYMSLETLHKSRGGKFKRNDKKDVAAIFETKNREKGTLETKNIIVKREVMRDYITQKVVPSIQALWPMDNQFLYSKIMPEPIFYQMT
jgi:hypothetical protein